MKSAGLRSVEGKKKKERGNKKKKKKKPVNI